MGPGQSVCYLHPQELGAADSLYCCVVDEEWCVTGLAPLLGFVSVQGQVVDFARVHQISPPLCRLHPCHHGLGHYCRVIYKLVVISGPGTTVVGHQHEQQWTQDAALRGAGAQGDDIGGVVAHPHRLWSVD